MNRSEDHLVPLPRRMGRHRAFAAARLALCCVLGVLAFFALGLNFPLESALAREWSALEASVSSEQAEAKAVSLEVVITGLQNDKGKVAIALFNTAEGFPEQASAVGGRLVKSSGRSARARFAGLAPGRYAVAVLHDENGNDKMDFNFLGIPKEGFGFSRNPKVLFGAPSFEATALLLRVPFNSERIVMRYF